MRRPYPVTRGARVWAPTDKINSLILARLTAFGAWRGLSTQSEGVAKIMARPSFYPYVIDVIVILTVRSVRRAEERSGRGRILRVHGPIRSTSGVCATTDAAQGEKRLFNWQNQVILTSDGRPLGDCWMIAVDGDGVWFIEEKSS